MKLVTQLDRPRRGMGKTWNTPRKGGGSCGGGHEVRGGEEPEER